MRPSRPGRSGTLVLGQAGILAALLIGLALSAPPVPGAPGGTTRGPTGIAAVARPAGRSSPGPAIEPAAPDPAGPDSPGITSLVSAWNPAVTTTTRAVGAGAGEVSVASPTGFVAGDSVAFGVTVALDTISAVEGSLLVLGSPLAAALPAGTSVVRTTASSSSEPAISADGRFVAFTSTATTLAPGATDGFAHVYEFDRTTSVIQLVSSATILVGGKPEQLPAGSQAIEPSVSADGSVIAYVVVIPTIVGAAVVPGGAYVVVHDNATGEDRRLAPGSRPSISANGRLVAFETTAALVPALDANKAADVYVIDRTTGIPTLASAGANGHAPNAASGAPSLAGNGRSVAFTSAGRLLSVDHDPASDVYVRNLVNATTTIVSVHAGADSGPSSGASISADGRYVAFSSRAATLAPGPRAGGGSLADLYVRDLVGKTTIRLSHASSGGAADGASTAPGISADGRTIAFVSSADNLVPGDTNHGPDVFIVARLGGRISRASITSADSQASPASSGPVLSADGAILAIQSTAHDLAPGARGSTDTFVRVRQPRAQVTPAALPFAARPAGSTSPPQLVTVMSVGAAPLVVAGASLGGADPGAFEIVSNGCAGVSLVHGQACTIGVAFHPAVAGTSLAQLVVTDNDPVGSQVVALTGGTLAPVLTVDPLIGPAGFVARAIGTNFPPGATIDLAWSVGLTASMAPVVADSSGSFSVQILILPRDTLGPRTLVGTFSAAGGGSAQSAPFLVVPGTVQPPFDLPRIPGVPAGPVFRR